MAPAVLGSSTSRLKMQQVLTRLSQQFQIDLETLRRQVADIRAKQRPRRASGNQTPAIKAPVKLLPLESELLQLILRSQELIDQTIENISPNQFVEGPCREIYETICHCYHEGQTVSFDLLMLQLEDPELKFLLDSLEEESQKKLEFTETTLGDQLNEVIFAFDREALDLERRAAIAELSQPELNQQEEARILEQLFQKAKERQGS